MKEKLKGLHITIPSLSSLRALLFHLQPFIPDIHTTLEFTLLHRLPVLFMLPPPTGGGQRIIDCSFILCSVT